MFAILESWCYPKESGSQISKELYVNYSDAIKECHSMVDKEYPTFVGNIGGGSDFDIDNKIVKECGAQSASIVNDAMEPTVFYCAEVIKFDKVIL